ncbi:hypothetical protein [Francisella tularensis]|uniref:hypothetical protein n=1 Tax=Francisella tularensis TaxID=263 RepID=UPI001C0F1615|nr:hypothetical protein [Francisella tularensis]MBK2109326.1 hypothetical protein [Francisella tularensis subsp. novicida FSC595]
MINSSLNNSQVTGDTPSIGGNITGTTFDSSDCNQDDRELDYIYNPNKTWASVFYKIVNKPTKKIFIFFSIFVPLISIYVFFWAFSKYSEYPQWLAYYIYTTTFIIYPIYILLIYFLIYRASD